MAGSDRQPSPVRAVLSVWYRRNESSTPRFSWGNGIALGLMLAVDVLFGISLIRLSWDLANAFPWVLVLYAAGLTAGVARVRPRPGCERFFPVALVPLLLQIVVYLGFWGGAAGVFPWDVFTLDGGTGMTEVGFGCFLLGFAFPVVAMPWTRAHGTLLVTESAGPIAFLTLLSY